MSRRKHYALNEPPLKDQAVLDQMPKVAFTARFSDNEEREVNHQPHVFDNMIECDMCGVESTELYFIPTARANKCYAVDKASGWRFMYPPGWVCSQCRAKLEEVERCYDESGSGDGEPTRSTRS